MSLPCHVLYVSFDTRHAFSLPKLLDYELGSLVVEYPSAIARARPSLRSLRCEGLSTL